MHTTNESAPAEHCFPRPGAAGTPGAALPTPGTPFVGRAQELSRLRTLLHEERARLVTIVGLGGSGKTRLAIEAAAGELATGREVAFVSLAAADSAEAAAGSVVEALGLPWEGNDAERSLLGGLKDQPHANRQFGHRIERQRRPEQQLLLPDKPPDVMALEGVRFAYPGSPTRQLGVDELRLEAGDRAGRARLEQRLADVRDYKENDL